MLTHGDMIVINDEMSTTGAIAELSRKKRPIHLTRRYNHPLGDVCIDSVGPLKLQSWSIISNCLGGISLIKMLQHFSGWNFIDNFDGETDNAVTEFFWSVKRRLRFLRNLLDSGHCHNTIFPSLFAICTINYRIQPFWI